MLLSYIARYCNPVCVDLTFCCNIFNISFNVIIKMASTIFDILFHNFVLIIGWESKFGCCGVQFIYYVWVIPDTRCRFIYVQHEKVKSRNITIS